MAVCKTVGELIERLSEFEPTAELDLYISWYDRHNYNSVHRDIWKHSHNGIGIYVVEEEHGIVKIANDEESDIALYE